MRGLFTRKNSAVTNILTITTSLLTTWICLAAIYAIVCMALPTNKTAMTKTSTPCRLVRTAERTVIWSAVLGYFRHFSPIDLAYSTEEQGRHCRTVMEPSHFTRSMNQTAPSGPGVPQGCLQPSARTATDRRHREMQGDPMACRNPRTRSRTMGVRSTVRRRHTR